MCLQSSPPPISYCAIFLLHLIRGRTVFRMCAVRSLPLAVKALTTPHCFDSGYIVPVYLDEPLWREGWGRGQLPVEMLALCLQLDATIVTESAQTTDNDKEESDRKVTFHQKLPARVSGLLDQMVECLRTTGHYDMDLETYLRESGVGYIFPRVELCLQEPDQDLRNVTTNIMDNYLSQLSLLHSVVTLAQQLSSDVQTSSSHKYIAHQTALLYQCVGRSNAFSDVKKDIEQHFAALKCSSTAEPGHLPRLSSQLQTWLVSVCHKLQNEATSLSPGLIQSLHDVLITLLF